MGILVENSYILGSDIRDARSQDPIARRRLADLIRDACINVTSRRYLIWPKLLILPRLDFSTVSCDFHSPSFEIIWNDHRGSMSSPISWDS